MSTVSPTCLTKPPGGICWLVANGARHQGGSRLAAAALRYMTTAAEHRPADKLAVLVRAHETLLGASVSKTAAATRVSLCHIGGVTRWGLRHRTSIAQRTRPCHLKQRGAEMRDGKLCDGEAKTWGCLDVSQGGSVKETSAGEPPT